MPTIKKVTFTLILLVLVSVAQAAWPSIKLIVTSGLKSSFTQISFNNSMTRGLDLTYDAGMLSGGADLVVYSYLVEDYMGIKFTIQALPETGYSSMIIPIGIDFATGGDVVFSAVLTDMVVGYRVILEDKVTRSFTDLSTNTYTVAIPSASGISGRFQLHYSPPQTSWNGSLSSDWNTPANWTPGTVPLATDNVYIPHVIAPNLHPVLNPGASAFCSNLTVGWDAALTISAGSALSVNGTLTNNANNGVITASDNSGTGSLIISSSADGSGSAIAEGWLTGSKWNFISSPLSGQSVMDFLGVNVNIPTNAGGLRGMMDYNPVTNLWNAFFSNATDYGILGAGRGFSMRVGAANAKVTFTGNLQAGPINLSVLPLSAGYWNCIGNPYTSAIGINDASGIVANFLKVNVLDVSNIDPAYGAIYVWEKTDANATTGGGQYTVVSNVNGTNPFSVQQGQAFMVKMNSSASNITFTPNMQFHSPALGLKSAEEPWPTIKLETVVDGQISSTIIAFNNNMTKGLDPTYDAGLLKGASDLVVYSKLVDDIGIPFAIQALPENNYNRLIIPVGIDFKTGGEVIFSAGLINMPSDCKAILEDKLSKTFTDLSKNCYTVAIPANSIISDRFSLHTSDQTISKLGNEIPAEHLSAFANKNIEIRVVGDVANDAVATLYDVQGRVVLIENLNEGSLNVISTSNIKNGIYLLSVKDKGALHRFKLVIGE